MVDALATAIKDSAIDPASVAAVAEVIDGAAFFSTLATVTEATGSVSLSEEQLRALGIELLIKVALAVVNYLQGEQQGTTDMESRAGMVDLLAVVGLGFPAWTGGPISLLSMIQYSELDGFDVPSDLAALVNDLPVQLKSAAGYMFTAKAVG
jgi:hypothetical protein